MRVPSKANGVRCARVKTQDRQPRWAAQTKAIAIAPGTACTQRIFRLAVAAPKTPETSAVTTKAAVSMPVLLPQTAASRRANPVAPTVAHRGQTLMVRAGTPTERQTNKLGHQLIAAAHGVELNRRPFKLEEMFPWFVAQENPSNEPARLSQAISPAVFVNAHRNSWIPHLGTPPGILIAGLVIAANTGLLWRRLHRHFAFCDFTCKPSDFAKPYSPSPSTRGSVAHSAKCIAQFCS